MASVLAYLFFVNVLSSLLRSNLQVEGFRLQDDGQSDPWQGFEETSQKASNSMIATQKFGGLKEKTGKDFVDLVKSFTPLLPPPAGVALGGALSLLGGIFGWRDTNLDDILEAITQGFAMISAKLEEISKKLDHVIAAVKEVKQIVTRIETKVDLLLKQVFTKDVKMVQDVFAEMMTRIKLANEDGTGWGPIQDEMRKYRDDLATAVTTSLKPEHAKEAINFVHHAEKQGGWCDAKLMYEDFVLARMQAFTMLWAMEVVPEEERNPTARYGQSVQKKLKDMVHFLQVDMEGYWEIQKDHIKKTGTLFTSGKTGAADWGPYSRGNVFTGSSWGDLNNWDNKEDLCKDAECSGYCIELLKQGGSKFMFYEEHSFLTEDGCTPERGSGNCLTCYIRNSERCWDYGVGPGA